ncbi:MAG: NADH-quinone oxidoreductase subunit L [Clostridiales Family XIII bacterium]|nr:NADH-quinone oxidoreductase subunit L [Clostridiales Family XIII bacterium]
MKNILKGGILSLICVLILLALVTALVLLVIKPDANKKRGAVVFVGSGAIAALSFCLAIKYLGKNFNGFFPGEKEFSLFGIPLSGEHFGEFVSYGMLSIEIAIAIAIVYLGFKYKNYFAPVLSIIQIGLSLYFEFGIKVEAAAYNFYIDRFSVIMVLIIGIIGTLICVYALPYMKEHAKHLHKGEKDRTPYFFFLLFLFLAAMFGIVMSNNLQFMLFFWEITTLCSFLLIGYTKTDEAIKNSFRAVNMNLLGGLAFIIALILIGKNLNIIELNEFVKYAVESKTQGGNSYANISLLLLAFAGVTKAAQIPFSTWLLGAMVAPTPTSALLHSSTMVKAGVFLIIKLGPALGLSSFMDFTSPGFFVCMIGGITFLISSFQAITQSNAKRVLAYSTVANLGLIITCAGIGTPAAIWSAIFLTIFHAVTKSLLFLCVGTAEHNIGSRDIEDMDGLFNKMPRLALFMIIGISAMYLAPFGMLISKWAALQSFITDGTPLLTMVLAFGSAITLFYWTKWLGKMVAVVSDTKHIEKKTSKLELAVQGTLSLLVAATCILFPLISKDAVAPYVKNVSGQDFVTPIAFENLVIMVILVVLIIVLPVLFYGRSRRVIKNIYLAGAGEGDDRTYIGSMEKDVKFSLKNWYMESTFSEKLMQKIGYISTFIVIGIVFAYQIGIQFAINIVTKMMQGGF